MRCIISALLKAALTFLENGFPDIQLMSWYQSPIHLWALDEIVKCKVRWSCQLKHVRASWQSWSQKLRCVIQAADLKINVPWNRLGSRPVWSSEGKSRSIDVSNVFFRTPPIWPFVQAKRSLKYIASDAEKYRFKKFDCKLHTDRFWEKLEAETLCPWFPIPAFIIPLWT